MSRSRTRAAAVAVPFALALLHMSSAVHGLENGVASTPALGWNTWNSLRCETLSESTVLEVAAAMISSGLRDAGFRYIVIDDCWMAPSRHPTLGTLMADPIRFPSGMKSLGDKLHELGFLFGIYSDAGTKTCEGLPASYGNEAIDALTFAAWGVDYLKYDFCNTPPQTTPQQLYSKMSRALNATGRPMVFSLCSWGVGAPFDWARPLAHSWRTGRDVFAVWDEEATRRHGLPNYLQSVMQAVQVQSDRDKFAGVGAHNDLDMLVVGLEDGMQPYGIVKTCPPAVPECRPGEYISRERWGRVGGLNAAEERAHFFLWVLMASPLMLGHDPRHMKQRTRELITAPEVLGIQRDAMAAQGYRTQRDGTSSKHEVWCKPLAGDGEHLQFALLLFNPSTENIRANTASVDLRLSLIPFAERHGKTFEDMRAEQARKDAAEDAKDHPSCTSPDSAEHCQGWADTGECEKNPGFMRTSCACSCARRSVVLQSPTKESGMTAFPPSLATTLADRMMKERAAGKAVRAHIRDAFARADLGIVEDNFVWPGEIEAHGAELLLVTVLFDGASYQSRDTKVSWKATNAVPHLDPTGHGDVDSKVQQQHIEEELESSHRRETLVVMVLMVETIALFVMVGVVARGMRQREATGSGNRRNLLKSV